MSLTDKIEHRQAVFARRQPQAPPQLLQKYGQAFGRPQKQHRVDFGNIHPFIVEVHHKQKPQLAADQPVLGTLALFRWRVGGQMHRRNLPFVELFGHKPRVFL